MDTTTGSCLCGAFRFEVAGPLENVRLCHCDLCRRSTGSAYSANCRVPATSFRVLTAEPDLSEYESSPGATRVFCSRCGSPVFARVASDPEGIRVRLGTLDRQAKADIVAHVWVGSMAMWDSICDDLPRHEKAAEKPRESDI